MTLPVIAIGVSVAAFLLAGTVKGVLGMGLPTVAMGLLALEMPPAQAAALLIIPSMVTNVWQLLMGPKFGALVRRLWSMNAAILVGTLITALNGGLNSSYAVAALGATLIIYGAISLLGVQFTVRPEQEYWVAPLCGLISGLIAGATGVFTIPTAPYLQAIGLEKDDLVQALGLTFSISTVGLAVALAAVGDLRFGAVGLSLLALAPALIGLYAGQWVRGRVSQATFRLFFLYGLIVLGIESIVRAFI
jgi:uncharacterized membrane protein YfcA